MHRKHGHRKSTGRTLEELGRIFNQFRAASLCFAIAHAYQVDTSMTEAFRILRACRHRIVRLRIREVTSSGKHARISDSAVRAYRKVVHYLPHEVPVILETLAKKISRAWIRCGLRMASRGIQMELAFAVTVSDLSWTAQPGSDHELREREVFRTGYRIALIIFSPYASHPLARASPIPRGRTTAKGCSREHAIE